MNKVPERPKEEAPAEKRPNESILDEILALLRLLAVERSDSRPESILPSPGESVIDGALIALAQHGGHAVAERFRPDILKGLLDANWITDQSGDGKGGVRITRQGRVRVNELLDKRINF